MKKFIAVLFSFFLFVGSLSSQHKKNVLLICIDDLRPELACFGADYIKSPHIDALAKKSRMFRNHYVNAPSCGPSRYTLLTGVYGPPKNNALFLRSKKVKEKGVTPSMPEWFRSKGYTTVSIGKVSHHPGGMGGKNWDDPSVIEMPNAWDEHLMPVAEWQHPRGAMHGLANGEIRMKPAEMDVYQSVDGDDFLYPDGSIAEQAMKTLGYLTQNQEKPFFLAVGFIRPHLPFGAPKKYLDLYQNTKLPSIPSPQKPKGKSTWHASSEFMKYNRWGKNPNEDKEFAEQVRLHYAACVSYADAQVGKLLKELKNTGADKNTIVVLWGDHGWNLGDHGIWGKHNLFEEGLHSPLLISYPGLKKKGNKSNAIVETVDVFPTLCELTENEIPNFTSGTSLLTVLEKPKNKGHVAFSYNSKATSIRTDRYRFTKHKTGEVELYDHQIDPFEKKNIAANNPTLVKKLTLILNDKVALKSKY